MRSLLIVNDYFQGKNNAVFGVFFQNLIKIVTVKKINKMELSELLKSENGVNSADSIISKKNDKGKLTIQPKLTIGQPNDKYEQEADRIADQVMKISVSSENKSDMSIGNSGAGNIHRKRKTCYCMIYKGYLYKG